jgi:hypothetical protein
MGQRFAVGILSVLLLTTVPVCRAQQLLVNGGFEHPDSG